MYIHYTIYTGSSEKVVLFFQSNSPRPSSRYRCKSYQSKCSLLLAGHFENEPIAARRVQGCVGDNVVFTCITADPEESKDVLVTSMVTDFWLPASTESGFTSRIRFSF